MATTLTDCPRSRRGPEYRWPDACAPTATQPPRARRSGRRSTGATGATNAGAWRSCCASRVPLEVEGAASEAGEVISAVYERSTEGFETADRMTARLVIEEVGGPDWPASDGRHAVPDPRMNFSFAFARRAPDSIHMDVWVQSPSRNKSPSRLPPGGWKGVFRMRKTKHLLGGFMRGQWAGNFEPDDAVNALALGLIAASIALLASLAL